MGKLNAQKLKTRALSAAVLIPVTLGAIWAGGWLFLIFMIIAAFLAFGEWRALAFRHKQSSKMLLLGVGYLFIAFTSFYFLRDQYSFTLTILFMILVWSSDTGAYFVGKFLGRKKMAEAISPNKTVAGLYGAVFTPTGIAFLAALVLGNGINMSILFGMMGLITGLAGQGGDLLISKFKRETGVKDTGNLIPGHGGLLDRVDSILPNAPLFLAFLYLVGYGQ